MTAPISTWGWLRSLAGERNRRGILSFGVENSIGGQVLQSSKSVTAISRFAVIAALTITVLASLVPAAQAQSAEDGPVVHGVLFFSPSCSHCEYVINEILPDMFVEFGGPADVLVDPTVPPEDLAFYKLTNGSLELLLVDATTPHGSAMYAADIDRLDIPGDRTGVPRLSIGDAYYVGSQEIPDALPGIVTDGLAGTGVPYPDIEGIEEALAGMPGAADGDDSTTATGLGSSSTTEGSMTTTTTIVAADPFLPGINNESWRDRFTADTLGNSISVIVLVAMLVSLLAIVVRLRKGERWSASSWIVPVLAVVGFTIAAYLGIVETSGSEAVCGPVGDCNAVQQSEWAELFGVPIGIIGMVGYAAILIGWGLSHFGKALLADIGLLGMAGVAVGGTVFSVYLTFLEPFVIGATCMWCISSAITITALAWVTSSDGWEAMHRLRGMSS